LDINLRKKLVKCYIWIIELYGAEILTLQKVDQKCLESFEMRCWRRMESISWTDHVRSEVLHTTREKRNILHSVKRRKADWLGNILHRNCLLKHVIEGRIEGEIEVTGRQGGRHKQLLNDLMEMRILEMERVSSRSYCAEKLL
jgi:hypothetical protein